MERLILEVFIARWGLRGFGGLGWDCRVVWILVG